MAPSEIGETIERRTEAFLKTCDLSLWQFDVLATLRCYDRDFIPW